MTTPSCLARIHADLAPQRQALLEHPIYRRLNDLEALRLFMQDHVFAVWDFMSLLKALQRTLCCVQVPWIPPEDRLGCRLVNEIVMAEESDEDGKGGYCSHFDLYRRAMRQCGADTRCVDRFLDQLRKGIPYDAALAVAEAPFSVRQFVGHTLSVIGTGQVCAIAASFAYGREDLLPDVFQRIVDELNIEAGGGFEDFRFYLARHIELDGSEHGPSTGRLIEMLCGNDSQKWRAAQDAAAEALEFRKVLWDGILERLSRRHREPHGN